MPDAQPDITDYATSTASGDLMPPATAAQQALPSIGGYLGDVFSGRIAAKGLNALSPPYDPNQSFAQNALNPQGIENAANIAMGVSGGGLGIRAFHGSPHDFDAFDISKIGTGQKAQTYGHGLYFAEAEPTAKSYQESLSGNNPLLFRGQPVRQTDQWSPQRDVAGWLHPPKWGQSVSDMMAQRARDMDAQAKFMLASKDPMDNAAADMYVRAAERIRAQNPADWSYNPGRMYEVNIEHDPLTMLDWDALATQQPENVNAALNKFWLAAGGKLEGRQYPPFSAHGETTGQSLHAALSTNFGSEAKVAERLRDEGVPGIRYLDQQSRIDPRQARLAIAHHKAQLDAAFLPAIKNLHERAIAKLEAALKNPTRNYVIFDDKNIDIIRKYGLGALMTGSGAAAVAGGGDGGS